MTLIATTLWLLFPAGVANAVPLLIARIPFLAIAVDGGLSWRGHRLTGDHKTVRGFLFGTLAATLASYLEFLLYPLVAGIVAVDYVAVPPLALGAALGFGALLGDSVKSFFKRQFNIEEGKSWPPFDQLDWVAGALFALAFFMPIPLPMIAAAFILGIPLHAAVRALGGFLLGFIEKPSPSST